MGRHPIIIIAQGVGIPRWMDNSLHATS
jgi:hypothetical protein